MKRGPISIRPESSSDHSAIWSLIIEVFRQRFGSGEAEATLVDQLRQQQEFGSTLSLVAEKAGVIVGQVFFSAVRLDNHSEIPVCALAPLSVLGPFQKQGIGSQLVREGLKTCAERGYRAVFVQGSLQYYPRFGFVPIARTGLHTIFKSDHDMVLELESGVLEKAAGLVMYPKPWQLFK